MDGMTSSVGLVGAGSNVGTGIGSSAGTVGRTSGVFAGAVVSSVDVVVGSTGEP
jgi:hypothetical protein